MTGLPIPPKLGLTVEKLTQRYDLFQILRQSHLRWINETDDPQIKEIHRNVAALLVSLQEQYSALMNALQSRW